MRLGLSKKRPVTTASSGGGTPAPSLIYVNFGNLTRAGVTGDHRAGISTLANSITSGDPSGYFQILNVSGTNYLCVSAAGAAASLGGTGATYSLILDNGDEIRVTTIANCWSCATQTEWDFLIAQSTATLQGKIIEVRRLPSNGVYTSGVDGVVSRLRRADFASGGTPLTIRGADTSIGLSADDVSAATSFPIFDKFVLRGTKNVKLQYLDTPETITTKFTVIGEAANTATGITIDHCRIRGIPQDPNFDFSAGIGTGTGQYPNSDMIVLSSPDNSGDLTVTDNFISWCLRGVNAGVATGAITTSGNRIKYFYDDGLNITYAGADTLWTCEDNVISHAMGKPTDTGNPHPDFIRGVGRFNATTDWTVKIRRNRCWYGNARGVAEFMLLSDFNTISGNSGHYYIAEVTGNVWIGDTTVGLSVENAKNCIILNNTVLNNNISSPTGVVRIQIGTPSTFATSSGTHIIRRNVADVIQVAGSPTLDNNVQLGSGGSTTAYSTAFVGNGANTWSPDTLTELMTMLNMKVSGPLDIVGTYDVGAIGTGANTYATSVPGHDGGSVTELTPVNGDPLNITVLNATSPVTSPTNNIDGSGWVAAVTFKGMSIGQTLTPSKVQFTVSEPGFDSSGNATTVSRTITGTKALRLPLAGQIWTTGTTYTAGTGYSNHVFNKTGGSNTTKVYRCTAAGGGTSTVAPTHTTGSVTGADGYTWLFVSNTTQSDSPPQFPVEVTSGSDAIAYVVLDKFVSSSATITAVNIAAGAYGSSNASISAICTTTNNSTFTPFKPHAEWATMPWQVAGNTFHVELYADHPFGQSGRMCAAVLFRVYDNAGTYTGVSALATSMVQSSHPTTTNGNPLPVFAADLDTSSLTNGSLYSVRATAYPFMGASWDSDTDGFGSATSGWTISTKMTANTSKRIPFVKDSSAYTIQYAVVDGVGAGTPTVQTSLATARTTPFASINAAATALQTANGGTLNYKTICYIKGGTTLTAFGGDMTTRTYGTSWFLIARDPGDATVAQINPDTVTVGNRKPGGRIKFQNISFVTTVATPVIDNIATTGVGDFQYETWFDRCVLTGVSGGTQSPLARVGLFWITNSLLTSTANMQGTTRSAWKLSLGNRITETSTDSPLMNAVHHLGDKMGRRAVPSSSITTTSWNENSQLIDCQIFAFCSWFNNTVNVAAFPFQYTTGGSWTNNFIEANITAAKGGQLSADSVAVVTGRIYNLYNGAAGDGQNFCYNESTTTQVKKYGIAKFNALRDRNAKSDWWDSASPAAAARPERTGNWSVRYGVDWSTNIVCTATFTTPSSANLSGEVLETGSLLLSSTAGYTSDRSKVGTGAGNGDYRPTTSSVYKGRIGATAQMLPFDLNGTTRKTDGTGAVGPYEWA